MKGGYNFYLKNKLKSEIFNHKKKLSTQMIQTRKSQLRI